MKEISHENLNKFIGLCVVNYEATVLTLHCPRGSLQVSARKRQRSRHNAYMASQTATAAAAALYVTDRAGVQPTGRTAVG